MPENRNRSDAADKLSRHGIAGSDVYFVDIVPLIEMIWADGKVQQAEKDILDHFLERHVRRINQAAGREAITLEQGRAFVHRFLKERPDPALLETLRNLIPETRMTGKPGDAYRDSILAACLDIASSARTYPYGLHDRFDLAEKLTFFEILNSLQV